MEPRNPGSEPIKAYVVLKETAQAPSAAPVGLARGTSGLVATRRGSDDLRLQLERMGFYVKRVTPLSIVVEAPRKTFEYVFSGKLGRKEVSAAPSGWHWKGAVRIPDELRERVDTVVFPEPVRLHL